MKCDICGDQAWCVDQTGEVQERTLCYDCEALCEYAEDLQYEEAVAAYEKQMELEYPDYWGPEDGGACPCGGITCDGTCGSNKNNPTLEDIDWDAVAAEIPF